jgi:trk system potassium uptake protein TrkA
VKVLVVGCGRVGSGLAASLEIDSHAVTVIDREPKAMARLSRGFAGRSVVGNALDRDVLEQAGIGEADALAAVTGSDEINAVVSRLASRRFRVPRVVSRMYEPRQADLYGRLGVLTISPVEWGVTRVAQLLTLSDLAPIVSIGGRVNLVEATIAPSLAGRRAEELEVPGETRVISVTRSGRTFLGDRATLLESGDVVAVAVTQGSETRLQQLLGVQ